MRPFTLDEVIRQYILHTVQCCGDNISEAARVLGIYRSSLQRRLQRYGTR